MKTITERAIESRGVSAPKTPSAPSANPHAISSCPSSRWRSPTAVLAASWLALAPALAQHHVEYGLNLSLGPNYYENYSQGAQPSGPIDHEELIPDYGRAAGTANVGFGVNKARIELSGTNPGNPLDFDYGFATSRYWDSFQFDDPPLNGTHGFFDVTLYVAGTGSTLLRDQFLSSPDTEFDAFWHAVINVSVAGVTDTNGSPVQSGYYAGEWYKGLDERVLQYFGDPLNTYQQVVTFEFIYGQPILMDTFLQVDVQFDNQLSAVAGTLDSVIDLGNSSYWGGIRRLRDAQGHLVTNALYSSSSGYDYRVSLLDRPILNVARTGGQLRFTWTGNAQLQGAPTPQGPFSTIPNASSPFLVSPSQPQQFYRLVLGP